MKIQHWKRTIINIPEIPEPEEIDEFFITDAKLSINSTSVYRNRDTYKEEGLCNLDNGLPAPTLCNEFDIPYEQLKDILPYFLMYVEAKEKLNELRPDLFKLLMQNLKYQPPLS